MLRTPDETVNDVPKVPYEEKLVVEGGLVYWSRVEVWLSALWIPSTIRTQLCSASASNGVISRSSQEPYADSGATDDDLEDIADDTAERGEGERAARP